MGIMSVRELNANISRALALVEAGDTIDITKNGVVIAEMRPKKLRRELDPIWKADFDALFEDFEKGVPFGQSFSYEERNG